MITRWIVEKDDNFICSQGREVKSCGTKVTKVIITSQQEVLTRTEREMRWAGRMTKTRAIEETAKYWQMEDSLNEPSV